MDRTSQYDVDSFNLKVNRYNSALRNRKAEAEVFNEMVDTQCACPAAESTKPASQRVGGQLQCEAIAIRTIEAATQRTAGKS